MFFTYPFKSYRFRFKHVAVKLEIEISILKGGVDFNCDGVVCFHVLEI